MATAAGVAVAGGTHTRSRDTGGMTAASRLLSLRLEGLPQRLPNRLLVDLKCGPIARRLSPSRRSLPASSAIRLESKRFPRKTRKLQLHLPPRFELVAIVSTICAPRDGARSPCDGNHSICAHPGGCGSGAPTIAMTAGLARRRRRRDGPQRRARAGEGGLRELAAPERQAEFDCGLGKAIVVGGQTDCGALPRDEQQRREVKRIQRADGRRKRLEGASEHGRR
jgi:hypothetical protein